MSKIVLDASTILAVIIGEPGQEKLPPELLANAVMHGESSRSKGKTRKSRLAIERGLGGRYGSSLGMNLFVTLSGA